MRQQTRRVLQGVAFCALFVGVAVFMRVLFQWNDYNTTLREYIGNPSLVSQEGTETDEKIINPSIEMATTVTADVTMMTSPGEVTQPKPPVSATTKSQKPLIVDSTSSASTLSIMDYSSTTPMVSTPSLKQKSDSLKVPASTTADKAEKQPAVSKGRVNDRLDTKDKKATALRQDSVKSVDPAKTGKDDTVQKPAKPGPVIVQPEQKANIQLATKDEQVKPRVVQKPAKGKTRQPAARQTPANAATTKKRPPTTRKGPRDLSSQRQTRSPTTPVPTPSHFGVIFDEFHPHFQFQDDNIHMVADPSSTQGKAGDYDVLERDYFRYLARIQFDCRRREPAGKVDYIDDSWELCEDPPYDLVKDKCLVYSFGIHGDWSFDDFMLTQGCTVHSFDSSMKFPEKERMPNNWFHSLALSGENNSKQKTATLGAIMAKLGEENRVLDYVKMDLEASHWDAIPTAIQEGSLSRVKQLGIKFQDKPSQTRARMLEMLYKQGFRIYVTNFHRRIQSTQTLRTIYECQEVHFVNINFLKFDEAELK